MLGIEPGSGICKANTLSIVLSLQPKIEGIVQGLKPLPCMQLNLGSFPGTTYETLSPTRGHSRVQGQN